jgi:hypothetical protein
MLRMTRPPKCAVFMSASGDAADIERWRVSIASDAIGPQADMSLVEIPQCGVRVRARAARGRLASRLPFHPQMASPVCVAEP